jgi:hypothetical protein
MSAFEYVRIVLPADGPSLPVDDKDREEELSRLAVPFVEAVDRAGPHSE